MKILVGLGTCGIAAGAEQTYGRWPKSQAAGGVRVRARQDRLHRHVLPRAAGRDPDDDGSRFHYGGVTADKVERLLDEHIGRGEGDRGLAGLDRRRRAAPSAPTSRTRPASCCATAA